MLSGVRLQGSGLHSLTCDKVEVYLIEKMYLISRYLSLLHTKTMSVIIVGGGDCQIKMAILQCNDFFMVYQDCSHFYLCTDRNDGIDFFDLLSKWANTKCPY